jgi:hypothetical protein
LRRLAQLPRPDVQRWTTGTGDTSPDERVGVLDGLASPQEPMARQTKRPENPWTGHAEKISTLQKDSP